MNEKTKKKHENIAYRFAKLYDLPVTHVATFIDAVMKAMEMAYTQGYNDHIKKELRKN